MAGSAVAFACGSEEIRRKGVEADWSVRGERTTFWCPDECRRPGARASGRSGRWQSYPSAPICSVAAVRRVATGALFSLVGSDEQGTSVSCCW